MVPTDNPQENQEYPANRPGDASSEDEEFPSMDNPHLTPEQRTEILKKGFEMVRRRNGMPPSEEELEVTPNITPPPEGTVENMWDRIIGAGKPVEEAPLPEEESPLEIVEKAGERRVHIAPEANGKETMDIGAEVEEEQKIGQEVDALFKEIVTEEVDLSKLEGRAKTPADVGNKVQLRMEDKVVRETSMWTPQAPESGVPPEEEPAAAVPGAEDREKAAPIPGEVTEIFGDLKVSVRHHETTTGKKVTYLLTGEWEELKGRYKKTEEDLHEKEEELNMLRGFSEVTMKLSDLSNLVKIHQAFEEGETGLDAVKAARQTLKGAGILEEVAKAYINRSVLVKLFLFSDLYKEGKKTRADLGGLVDQLEGEDIKKQMGVWVKNYVVSQETSTLSIGFINALGNFFFGKEEDKGDIKKVYDATEGFSEKSKKFLDGVVDEISGLMQAPEKVVQTIREEMQKYAKPVRGYLMEPKVTKEQGGDLVALLQGEDVPNLVKEILGPIASGVVGARNAVIDKEAELKQHEERTSEVFSHLASLIGERKRIVLEEIEKEYTYLKEPEFAYLRVAIGEINEGLIKGLSQIRSTLQTASEEKTRLTKDLETANEKLDGYKNMLRGVGKAVRDHTADELRFSSEDPEERTLSVILQGYIGEGYEHLKYIKNALEKRDNLLRMVRDIKDSFRAYRKGELGYDEFSLKLDRYSLDVEDVEEIKKAVEEFERLKNASKDVGASVESYRTGKLSHADLSVKLDEYEAQGYTFAEEVRRTVGEFDRLKNMLAGVEDSVKDYEIGRLEADKLLAKIDAYIAEGYKLGNIRKAIEERERHKRVCDGIEDLAERHSAGTITLERFSAEAGLENLREDLADLDKHIKANTATMGKQAEEISELKRKKLDVEAKLKGVERKVENIGDYVTNIPRAMTGYITGKKVRINGKDVEVTEEYLKKLVESAPISQAKTGLKRLYALAVGYKKAKERVEGMLSDRNKEYKRLEADLRDKLGRVKGTLETAAAKLYKGEPIEEEIGGMGEDISGILEEPLKTVEDTVLGLGNRLTRMEISYDEMKNDSDTLMRDLGTRLDTMEGKFIEEGESTKKNIKNIRELLDEGRKGINQVYGEGKRINGQAEAVVE